MLYIAGKFKTVDAFTRQRLAAFNGAGALSGTWRPRTSGLARSFATTCDGSQIIVGGSFEKAAGTGASFQDRKLAAIFDKTTGRWTRGRRSGTSRRGRRPTTSPPPVTR